MANEKINEYLDSAIVPDALAEFDMDNWIGGVFVSTRIKFSDLNASLTGVNLGSSDLTQSDTVRTFTLSSDEVGGFLQFENQTGNKSLTINGQCDVYNHGLQGVPTNLFYGLNVARLATGDNNSAFGVNAISGLTLGVHNVAIGFNAGRYQTATTNDNTGAENSIYIGSSAFPQGINDNNSIVIGQGAVGQGANTVVIGNGSVLGNYFTGNMYVTSLSGVGERNVVADANGMLKISPSTSFILHFTTLAGFPATGDSSILYIDDTTKFTYFWDTLTNQYINTASKNIYDSDSVMLSNVRKAALLTDDDSSNLHFTNLSGNDILRLDGARDVFVDNIKAPTGLQYFVRIDDAGMLNSVALSITPQDLAQVLAVGNSTGTNDILIDATQSVNFTGTSVTTAITAAVIGTPLVGFQYKVTGDLTSTIYVGSEITITGTPTAVNDGTFIITAVELSGGDTFFQWAAIITELNSPFGSVITEGSVGSLVAPSITEVATYTLQPRSGTIAMINTPIVSTPTGTTQIVDLASGTAQTIDLASATGNVTLTLLNPQAGETYIIKVIQDAITSIDLVYPLAVKWAGGIAPVISTGSLEIDTIVLFWDGASYYAAINQNFS